MIQLSQVGTVAAKEFRDRLRNRWVLAVALVFAVFSLVIAYAGGAHGVRDRVERKDRSNGAIDVGLILFERRCDFVAFLFLDGRKRSGRSQQNGFEHRTKRRERKREYEIEN